MKKRVYKRFSLFPTFITSTQGTMYYMGVHIGATWRIRLNRPCAAAIWPLCHITLITCCCCSSCL